MNNHFPCLNRGKTEVMQILKAGSLTLSVLVYLCTFLCVQRFEKLLLEVLYKIMFIITIFTDYLLHCPPKLKARNLQQNTVHFVVS